MKANILLKFLLVVSALVPFSCAEVKQAGKDIGHGTRDVTKAVGKGARDVTRAIGHGARDATKAVGKEIKKATSSSDSN